MIVLKFIKVVENGYALPVDLGSGLIKKVTSSESPYFNRTMFNNLDHALEIERRFQTKDLKLLRVDPSYSRYGTIEVCVIMQEEHSKLFVYKDWPDFTSMIPQANLGFKSGFSSSATAIIITISVQSWNAIKIPLIKRQRRDKAGRR